MSPLRLLWDFIFLVIPAALSGMIGAILTSLAITHRLRHSRGGTAFSGRSHCDHCGKALSWRETIPVVSYIAQGGRCRACAGKIPPAHLVWEAVGFAIGAAVFLVLRLHPRF